MPRKPGKVPSYCRHKASGRAVVRIDGRDHYLGEYGSPASHEEYERCIAEWRAGQPARKVDSETTGNGNRTNLTINELILAYWKHAQSYYVKCGRPTDEQAGIRSALRHVRRLYGRTRASEFGPLALKSVRQAMIEADLSRRVINQYVSRVRRMFRWAVENELVPVEVHQALMTVPGLRKNRSEARETKPVTPVADEIVDATLPFLNEVVQGMVRFHRITGCRPEDVCYLRPCDVDTSEEIWGYTPETHKMQHKDRDRQIYIGPKAQEILRPWLDRPGDAYCFSPKEATEMCLAKRRNGRTQTVPPRAQRKQKKNPRAPGDQYTRYSYRQAIERACKRAAVPKWTPNQLRHSRATEVRRRYGLKASQVVLGHARADVTQLYAERNIDLAIRTARETG